MRSVASTPASSIPGGARADNPPVDRLPSWHVSLAKGEKCVYTHPYRNSHPSDHALPHCTDTGYCLSLCWNDYPSDDKIPHQPDTRDTVALKVGAGENSLEARYGALLQWQAPREVVEQ